jgi:hypothetical protein
MFLSASQLRDNLCNAIYDKDNNIDAHTAVANVLNDYMNNNLYAMGMYTGIIAGTPPVPDPMSGIYTFSFHGCNINADDLVSQAGNGVDAWFSYVVSAICAMQSDINDDSNIITINPSLTIVPKPVNLDLTDIDYYVDAMLVIANAIVSIFRAPAVPTGGTVCSSNTGGQGSFVASGYLVL